MSLIFDNFPSRAHAEDFGFEVYRQFGRSWQIFDDQKEAFEADPYPFKLKPPIVHVSRRNRSGQFEFNVEPKIMALVRNFSGQFAGT